MELGLGFWGSKTLLTAVKLGVFTELSKQEFTLDTLIGCFNLNPRSAGDFFEALANKHISGGGFDSPEVKPIFNDYIRSLDLSDRLKFYIGHFFLRSTA
ncbi:MAG: hypothetical protein JXJ04_13670 [Spirochaetales bacterium]|nr:hypothetical protein [Spirochaetales bacterium]